MYFSLLKKNLSFYPSYFLNSIDLENRVFPLLKISKVDNPLSICDSCNFLKIQLDHYLANLNLEKAELEFNQSTIELYFRDLINGTLYTRTEPILNSIIILTTLLSRMSWDNDRNKQFFYQELFYAIKERACIDDHAYNLNKLLLHLNFSQVSSPIRKVVQYLHEKMMNQIHCQVLSLDSNFFNGFYDEQSTHSFHIIYMLLDDIFGIADGRYRNDRDILIPRTELAFEILKSSFHHKLTLKHLLFHPSQNWKDYLAHTLSSSYSYIGEAHISIHDLSEAVDFLDYLIFRNVITPEQSYILKHPSLIENDNELDFFKELALISTEIGEEKIIYTPFFAELIMQFIFEKIMPNNLTLNCNDSNSLFTFRALPKLLLEKVVLFFTSPESFPFFSYNDILMGMKDKDSESYQSFLKPYISLNTLMMAHCDPKYARLIYKKCILPHADLEWVLDCLILMGGNNYLAVKNIGFDDYINSKFHSSQHHLSLLQRMIKKNPQIISQWLKLKLISKKTFFKVISYGQDSVLHTIIQEYPLLLKSWIKENVFNFHELIPIKDEFKASVFHRIAQTSPEILKSLIVDGYITAFDLISNKDIYLNSILHIIAQYDSQTIAYLVQHDHISVQELLTIYNANNHSIAHSLVLRNPEPLTFFLVNKLILIEDLFFTKDNQGLSVIHWLAFYHSLTLERWVDQGLIDMNHLISHRVNHNVSVGHLLAEFNPQTIDHWVREKMLSPRKLLLIKNQKSESIMDWLSHFAPYILEFCIEKKLINVPELLNPQNHDLHSIAFCLATYNPHIIDAWIQQKLIPIRYLYEYKDKKGNTILHLIARHAIQTLQKWVDQNLITVSKISTINNIFKSSVLHMVTIYSAETFQTWVEKGLITFRELVNVVDSHGMHLFHWVAKKKPSILDVWLETKRTTIDELAKYRNIKGVTPVHYLAKFSCETLDKCVERGDTTVQKLILLKTFSNSSIIHWIGEYSGNTLLRWINYGFVTIQEVSPLKNNKNETVFDFLEIYYPDTFKELQKLLTP